MIDLTKERQLNLLKEISKCRSIDNNCDYLLEHSDCDDLIDYINYLQQENQKLKEQVDYLRRSIERKEKTIIDLQNERVPYTNDYVDKLENQQKEFIKYLENEKDRLARECSSIYEDDLGKTRLVNEDIFNEVNKISIKFKEIIGDNK